MDQNLSLSYALLKKYLPVTGEDEMYVLFELNQNSKLTERSPVHLSIVLDKSGSMSGKPLNFCKEAIHFLLNQLQEQDLISIVVFGSEVETVIPPQQVKHKDLLKKKINQIESSGMTNLSGGLIQGCGHILSRNAEEYVNRVILLSDGCANRGITNDQQMMKVVDDYQQAGVKISTIGVSDHFNEVLMEGIAEHGEGNYYFIREVEQIPEIFAQELDGLLSVAAQNVHFTIRSKNGVQVKNVFGYRSERNDTEVSISMGDMYSNEVKSILVQCLVPGMSAGIHDLFDVEWSFVDVTDGIKDCQLSLNIPIEFTSDFDKLAVKLDSYVEKQLEITKSALKIEEALNLFDSGDFESGKDIILKQAYRMSEKAKFLNDAELLAESQILFKQLEDFSYSKRKRKELHQEKYRQMKRRKQEPPNYMNLLKRYLNESSYTVIFTGAGMSTEAGLPDFRSVSSGMWNQVNPMELASTKAMKYNQQQFIEFYRQLLDGLGACQPHKGHEILAKWEAEGKIQSIISVNVDGFHHIAGNKNVLELHGTLRTCHCDTCGEIFPIERFIHGEMTCRCGGFIRPSVVLFGEQLPAAAFDYSEIEAKKADLFIVLGSSLSVSPSNLFPQIAKNNGAKLVIINLEKTDLDGQADLVINRQKIGKVLQLLDEWI